MAALGGEDMERAMKTHESERRRVTLVAQEVVGCNRSCRCGEPYDIDL